MKNKIKQLFISGILVIVPLFVTIFSISFVVSKLGGIWKFIFINIPFFNILPNIVMNIIGFIFSIFLILFLGYIGQLYIGRFFISIFETIFSSTPLLKNIYMPTREIMRQLFQQKKDSFKRVVVVKIFNDNLYTFAFVTNDEKWIIDGEDALSLFMPTSPNPTSGFFTVVKKKDTIETDFTIEEAFNLIVTSGLYINRIGEIDGRKIKRDN